MGYREETEVWFDILDQKEFNDTEPTELTGNEFTAEWVRFPKTVGMLRSALCFLHLSIR